MILPRAAVSAFSMNCFEIADRGLHGFGRLQHFGHNQLVVVEQPPDFRHAGHQRTVDDVERPGAFGALQVEIGDEAVLGAFDDVVGEALVERQIGGLGLHRLPATCGNVR